MHQSLDISLSIMELLVYSELGSKIDFVTTVGESRAKLEIWGFVHFMLKQRPSNHSKLTKLHHICSTTVNFQAVGFTLLDL